MEKKILELVGQKMDHLQTKIITNMLNLLSVILMEGVVKSKYETTISYVIDT